MSLASSILANRYLSGAAALIYDHLWNMADEIRLIWFNSEAGLANRVGFVVNRYLTEAVALYVVFGKWDPILMLSSCRIFIWILSASATVFTAISHLIITARVYTLWDRRPLIKWILMSAFAVAISVSLAFALLTAQQARLEANGMCAFLSKPWALPYALGALTGLDLFIIIMTIFNALDRPYQKQAEVVTKLQIDGARFFVCLFLLRLVNLVMSIVGDVGSLSLRGDS
ncbi:hypothetical protein B0H11DRAFT_2241652 [Mycena galericulata]|nr:hypothetical protein B0H11DRAFT_2241652 [Mycena galericulata]